MRTVTGLTHYPLRQKQVLKQMSVGLAGHNLSPVQETGENVAGWTI